ncbi:MAG TPA: nucleotide sugar dehydrogenase [Candidatus Sulfotelmatobacter sp.]|nr:nucleotide sugar dehydrogenase [Candidatus Sulfotelmatobacter sp.]
MHTNLIYYGLKPYLPWHLRMAVRRIVARRTRKMHQDVWPIKEAAGQRPADWPGWPDGKKFSLVLTHDVESWRGLAKCRQLMQLEIQMGFRSSFNFIPEADYNVSWALLDELRREGFEVGVQDLKHDGKLFQSRETFRDGAVQINRYLHAWDARGFRSAFMFHNLEWVHDLNVDYASCTFDTDPFEPQPDDVGTIFPFWVPRTPADNGRSGYVELPYTLPQDSTLFLVLQEQHPDIWIKKLDWIAERGGMVLLNTHPDFMAMNGHTSARDEYPVEFYQRFLNYVEENYGGMYWQALPKEIAAFYKTRTPSQNNGEEKNGKEKNYGESRQNQVKCEVNSVTKVTIFGMGYVGSVTAACLAKQGYDVTGVDSDPGKVDLINSCQSPIVEPGLEEILQTMVAKGRMRARTRCEALGDISLVCVGTPSNDNGSLDLSQVFRVCEDIGDLLKETRSYHVVNIRSTVIPGTVEGQIVPLLEKFSGKKAGKDFGVCMNPEFLRESTAMKDFYKPPFTIIGAFESRAADVVSMLYRDIDAPLEFVPIPVAETIKYACNSFHALKVTFANEIGALCKSLGVDSWQVMDIFCKDQKLNLSPYYLKPGFAFGGSCLPKDLRAITHLGRRLDLDLPLLESILGSNQVQIERAYDMVRRTGKTKVGIFGLSFKADSDDLRESPTVAFIEKLIGKGYQVAVYDSDVRISAIRGKNKRYIERALPHINAIMKSSAAEMMKDAEVLVICKKQKEFETVMAGVDGQFTVIDFVRLFENGAKKPTSYNGLCW